jgi:hypothetical protein
MVLLHINWLYVGHLTPPRGVTSDPFRYANTGIQIAGFYPPLFVVEGNAWRPLRPILPPADLHRFYAYLRDTNAELAA